MCGRIFLIPNGHPISDSAGWKEEILSRVIQLIDANYHNLIFFYTSTNLTIIHGAKKQLHQS